jgi:hypothetical protein
MRLGNLGLSHPDAIGFIFCLLRLVVEAVDPQTEQALVPGVEALEV